MVLGNVAKRFIFVVDTTNGALMGFKWALFFQRATRLHSSSSSLVDRGLCRSVWSLPPSRRRPGLTHHGRRRCRLLRYHSSPFLVLALPPILIDWILRVAWQLGARCKLSWKPPAPATSILSRVRRPLPSPHPHMLYPIHPLKAPTFRACCGA
jgi:hypothetical protein